MLARAALLFENHRYLILTSQQIEEMKVIQKQILLIGALILSKVGIVYSKMCVATEPDRFLCTDDATKVNAWRKKNPSDNFSFSDLGVEQELSTKANEREAVEKVMEEMKEYFINEVYAKPEYAAVRDTCKNENPLCVFWVSIGECDRNRSFMIEKCTAACRLCLQAHAFS